LRLNAAPAFWFWRLTSFQKQNGCQLFLTLTQEGLILREPALQLVSHYGQKLFAQLWTADRVRFVFERGEPPDCARDFPVTAEDIDHWALSTLRFIQFQELSASRRWRLWNAARRRFLRSGGSAEWRGKSLSERIPTKTS
jgi:hypothetical protein